MEETIIRVSLSEFRRVLSARSMGGGKIQRYEIGEVADALRKGSAQISAI